MQTGSPRNTPRMSAPLILSRIFAVCAAMTLVCSTPAVHAQSRPAIAPEALQSGSIEGTLTGPSGKSVAGVTISTLETGATATVDARGHYVLRDLAPGTYTLVAAGEGFSRLKITDVVVKPSTDTSIGIEEMPVHMKDGEVQTMEEIVVSAKKDVETMEKYVVEDTKPKPFSDRNVDLPRGIDDAQPYYIFDSKTMEQSGVLNVEDFLKQRLTMDTTSLTNSQRFNSGGATTSVPGNTSSINLRGLGTNETLILVDGRRMAGVVFPNSGVPTAYGQPDINGIPLAAIDHIEVLPSSASGIYGGSALGGVINIVLKKDYIGTEIKGTYESTWDGHAPIRTAGITFGTSLEGGKTSVLVSAQYSDSTPLYVRDRIALFNNGYNTIVKNVPTFFTFGTNLIPPLGSTVNIATLTGAPLTLVNGGASLNSNIATLPANYAYTTVASLGTAFIPGQWNLNPPNINASPNGLATPLGSFPVTKSVMASIRRKMSKTVELFAEFSYNSNRTAAATNPNSEYAYIPAGASDNPFNQDILVRYPLESVVPFNSTSTMRSVTIGAKFALPENWNAEFDYQWSISQFSDYFSGGGQFNGGFFQNGTFNPFDETIQGEQHLSTQLLQITNLNKESSQSTLNDLTLHAVGPIFHLPWGDPTLALALEHRKESRPNEHVYYFEPYYDQSPYNLNGAAYQTDTDYAQSQTIDSAYGEVDLPLVTSKNKIPLVNAASIQASTRVDLESVGTGTTGYTSYPPALNMPLTYNGATTLINGVRTPYHATAKYTITTGTLGFRYKPVEDVILRASYAGGFLPPTYDQLLSNPTVIANGAFIGAGQDPKNPSAGSYSTNAISGGNPNLKPQSSKAWNAGLIWEPKGSVFKGLRVDLEYSKIDQMNVITSPGATFILSNANLYGSRITRDPTTGLVTLLDLSNVNLYKRESEYWDLSIDYRKSTPIGDFDLYAMGTVNEHLRYQVSPTLPDYDLVGFPGEAYGGGGVAKTKGNLALTWNYHHWTLGWSTEIYGSYLQVGGPSDPVQKTTKYTKPQGALSIPTQVYHDFFASYAFGNAQAKSETAAGKLGTDRLLSNLTLQVGVKNVFNKFPAFDAFNAPYYYSYYGDVRLRDFWISLKKAF